MVDYSKMSDDELLNAYKSSKKNNQPTDYSSMSDDELISQYYGNNNSSSIQQIDTSQYDNKPSPLNVGQNLMLGFMPEDSKAEYLKKEFMGRNVEQDVDGSLKVDGAPVNPQGFDAGDILRSVGYALPFGGQVAGNIGGAVLGTGATPGVGTLAGGFAGGVAGATAGEAARLSTGKFLLHALGKNLELNNEGQAFINSLADTAKSAAIGETVGLGIAGAGALAGQGVKALNKTQLYKGASDAWTKSINKLKTNNDPVADVLQFVGKIDKNATNIVLRDKPSVVLNEKYFDPDKTSKIASNALFGTEDFYSLGATNSNGVSKGSIALAKSIQEVDDPAYDYLLHTVGVDKEFIDGVRQSNFGNLINPVNTNNPNRGFELAKKSIQEIQKEEQRLGQELGRQELKAIREKGREGRKVYFNAEDLASRIDNIVGQGSLLKATKIPDYKSKPPMDINGADKLRELSKIFKGNKQKLTDSGVKITEKKLTPFETIPPKQLFNIKKQFDAKVDEIFKNERIPSEIRGQVKDIAKEFRSRYYSYLDIEDNVDEFSKFKDLTDGLKIDGRGSVINLENKLSNFKSITGAEQDEFVQAMSAIPKGNAILREINEFNVAQSLKKIDPERMIKILSAPLSSKKFLSSNTTDTAGEGILRKISDSIDEKFSNRRFTQEAERALAAKGFLGSNQDLLRIATLSGMLGLGGFKAFGPIGGALGAGLSLTLANPQNLGRMLLAAERNAPAAKALGSRIGKTVKLDRNKKALLNALIASKTNQEKQKQPVKR